MVQIQTIHQVPNDQVDRVKREFEREGASVMVTADGQDTSTIVATFPDQASPQGAAAAGMAG